MQNEVIDIYFICCTFMIFSSSELMIFTVYLYLDEDLLVLFTTVVIGAVII